MPQQRAFLLCQAEPFRHFLVEKAFSRTVGLEPFAVDDKLRDGALAGATDDFLGGAGSGFDVDLLIGELVLVEEALGDAAVGAPEGRVEGDLHAQYIDARRARECGRDFSSMPPRFAWRDSPRGCLCVIPIVVALLHRPGLCCPSLR